MNSTEWKEISSAGEPYGHVPGHSYHDVAIQSRLGKSGTVYVRAVEVWGSCQGNDEEHGRNVLVESDGSDLLSAVRGLPREAGEGSTADYYRLGRSGAVEEVD